MSDHDNAGEPREPVPETPALGEPRDNVPPAAPYVPPPPAEYAAQVPAKDPEAASRGVRAAAWIFAVAVALHLLTLVGVAVSGDPENALMFLVEGMFVVVVGLIAAIAVSIRLPRESRGSFWLSGVGFMALSFIVWGFTCGLALTTSKGS